MAELVERLRRGNDIHPLLSEAANELERLRKESAFVSRAMAVDADEIIELAEAENKQLRKAVESAWGIIANSYGGDWELANEDWRGAAERWRDEYASKIYSGDESNLPAQPVDA